MQETYSNIQKEKGVLVKQGKKFGFKIYRYFIIKGDCLLYFKSKTQQKIQGLVQLYSCKFHEVESFQKQYQYCIEIKGFSATFNIWILAEDYLKFKFYMQYLQNASRGIYRDNLFENTQISQQQIHLQQDSYRPNYKSHSKENQNNLAQNPQITSKNKEIKFVSQDLQNQNQNELQQQMEIQSNENRINDINNLEKNQNLETRRSRTNINCEEKLDGEIIQYLEHENILESQCLNFEQQF
ncbi:hypothetical protein PPERSA_04344 [Pseudocohnilembus persalinus]|uniref:PH domain-containing protein n=1 Tax=Pseudocohnilembus persalinus TaxID=266149 RepID=A0A0V0QQQ1_PSEPJ|nr:hypothetical protein PPERSA_04344 [Pseudocohnilembus persalinus]|eukprot:KRX04529.1 hypothetical protein PPERSA_04344 [Pseudocohnilembus persalinus]